MKPPDFKTDLAWDTTANKLVDVIKYNMQTADAPGMTYQIIHIPPQWCTAWLP